MKQRGTRSHVRRLAVLLALLFACLGLSAAWPHDADAGPLLHIFTVDTAADDPGITLTSCSPFVTLQPDCSLRGAIHKANQTAGSDTVNFRIAASGVQTINLTTPLESVNDVTFITGESELHNGGSCIDALARPCIVINGAGAGANAIGLSFGALASGSSVRALAIGGFTLAGISLYKTDNITIERNYIGTADGTTASPNGKGILGTYVRSNVAIGGTSATERNVISGNTAEGIYLDDPQVGYSNRVILGNYIGTNAAGTAALANGGDGISIVTGTFTIGGSEAGSGNVISGNVGIGIRIATSNNQVLGNFIGTNAAGTAALPNYIGVLVNVGSDNAIGSSEDGGGNLISGNASSGILTTGAATTIEGNYIGTDVTGMNAVPNHPTNGNSGAVEINAAPETVLGGTTAGARNVISGNVGPGVLLRGQPGATGATIMGNYIGVDASGDSALGNTQQGILVQPGKPANPVSGSTIANNVISGNGPTLFPGITLEASLGPGFSIHDNDIYGNLIGLDADGTTAIPNYNGIYVHGENGGAIDHIRIGHVGEGNGNVISGNTDAGVAINGAGVSGTILTNNLIGMNADGTDAIGNGAYGAFVAQASDTLFDSNTISGNELSGVRIAGEMTTVSNNYIGTNKDLDSGLGNGGAGVFITVSNNLVGNVPAIFSDGGAHPLDTGPLGNTIRNNGGPGVELESGDHNAISENSIDDNGGLGIKFDDPSVNTGIAAPVLQTPATGSPLLTGTLSVLPGTQYAIEVFSSPVCDPSGFGEGRTLLKSFVVSSNTTTADISTNLGPNAPFGNSITAIAVSGEQDDTSEFSNCVPLTPETTPSPTPSPTPTPTHSPSPAPSPTATGSGAILGDADCNGTIDMEDALADLSDFAGVEPGACDDRGDTDCDSDIDAVDALRIAAYKAGVPMTPVSGCGQVGS